MLRRLALAALLPLPLLASLLGAHWDQGVAYLRPTLDAQASAFCADAAYTLNLRQQHWRYTPRLAGRLPVQRTLHQFSAGAAGAFGRAGYRLTYKLEDPWLGYGYWRFARNRPRDRLALLTQMSPAGLGVNEWCALGMRPAGPGGLR